MSTSITVKTKFRINGQEYASVDDMPEEVRQTYERALSSLEGGPSSNMVRVTTQPGTTKIVFNGQEYASADQMPAAARRLYDDLMATVDAPAAAPAAGVNRSGGAPWHSAASGVVAQQAATLTTMVRPEPTRAWPLIAAVLAALLLISVWFGR